MTCPAVITVRGRSADTRVTCEQDEGHEGMHEARLVVDSYETVLWPDDSGPYIQVPGAGRRRP